MGKGNQKAFLKSGLINKDDGTRRFTMDELEAMAIKEQKVNTNGKSRNS